MALRRYGRASIVFSLAIAACGDPASEPPPSDTSASSTSSTSSTSSGAGGAGGAGATGSGGDDSGGAGAGAGGTGGGASAPACFDEVADVLKSVGRSSTETFASKPTEPVVWTAADNIAALLEMYRATHDARLLDQLAWHLDLLVANRAVDHGLVDAARGAALPAWGTAAYSCGKYHVHAAHTGMLAYPLAAFARIVLETPALQGAFGARAQGYLDAARSALAVHADELVIARPAGFYRHPDSIGGLGTCGSDDWSEHVGKTLPYNMILAMGRAHVELGRALEAPGATRDLAEAAAQLDRAALLAEFFRGALVHVPGTDSYDWKYALDGRPEDTAHASLDVRVAAHAFENGVAFRPAELRRFANTFVRVIAADPYELLSHTTPSYGGPSSKYQKPGTRWGALALVDPRVFDVVRDIYFNGNGETHLGRALLARWRPAGSILPTKGEGFSTDLPAHDPMASVQSRGGTGLYRTAAMKAGTLAGAAVTSCARYAFEREETAPLRIGYRHTREPVDGDTCAGDGCGSYPGLRLFTSADGETWALAAALPAADEDQDRTERVEVAAPYRYVAACRGGAGHGANNVRVAFVNAVDACGPTCGDGLCAPAETCSACAADCGACAGAGALDERFDFEDGTQGWAHPACAGYSYTRPSDERAHGGDGYVSNHETASGDSACDPAEAGDLEMARYRDFANPGSSFFVAGWTRASSSHAGTTPVTNRCVKVLDAATQAVLDSKCSTWPGVADTGWTYFHHDFTAAVAGVPVVRVAIGSSDSWGADWQQRVLVDDVRVHGAP